MKRQNLTEGTVIFDVGKGNGLKMLKDGISMIDHHGDGNKDVTSTTQILVESARGFKKYKDKKKNSEYLKIMQILLLWLIICLWILIWDVKIFFKKLR